MLNFTVGPVQVTDYIKKIGADDVPYFRTAEFSAVMIENERLILEFMHAPANSRAVFLTGSGTFAMETVVSNLVTAKDKAIVVNGGTFGQRFSDICRIRGLDYAEIKLPYGHPLTEKDLAFYEGKGFTVFLINVHETSTGVLYDMDMVGKFCKRNGIILIADAISAFLADTVDMERWGGAAVITSSQKALACHPGISIVALNENAVNIAYNNKKMELYSDFVPMLENANRGQTPFTPAVNILLQINARLKAVEKRGGVTSEIARTSELAVYFRKRIKDYPFEEFSLSPSNAVTALKTKGVSAYGIFTELKDNYGIWICPNGGELKDSVFRVGHLGDLSFTDYDKLFDAFYDLKNKGKL